MDKLVYIVIAAGNNHTWYAKTVKDHSFVSVILFGMAQVILASILVACKGETTDNPTRDLTYEIDPAFRAYYEQLGGVDTLGPAISPLIVDENKKYQYTQAALFTYDPEISGGRRIHLAPLGLEMDIAEPPVSRPDRRNARYVDGHIIYSEFLPLYEKLGGSLHVGRPLTEVHYNPEIMRYEQHFENIGIYISEADSSGEPQLLAYGAWKCDAKCRQQPLNGSQVVLPYHTDAHFNEAVTRLGIDFTGYAITDAYRTPDGYIEQVFANVVLVVDPQQPSRVFLRPVTECIGMLSAPLVESSSIPGFYFYPVQGENRGYNVPGYLWDYMALHGGKEVSGAPISELAPLRGEILRQCFVNLCLEVHQDENGNQIIRPSQLGYSYKQYSVEPFMNTPTTEMGEEQPLEAIPTSNTEGIVPGQPPSPAETELHDQGATQAESPQLPDVPEAPSPMEVFRDASSSSEVSIQVWESYPVLARNQSQEIGVIVFENGAPVRGIEPDLLLELPDGKTRTYYMYPTDDDGQTRLHIDPIDAPGGTLIPYQTCIFYPGGQRFCVRDSFVIWENP